MTKNLRFVGYSMSKGQMNKTLSIVETAVGPFGLHKRFFKTEDTFWNALHFVFGMRREATETYHAAIDRIHKTLKAMPREERAERIASIDREALYAAVSVKAGDFQVLGDTLILPRSETVRKLRAPKKLRPQKAAASSGSAPSKSIKDDFYKSWEWRTIRMEAIKEFGRACQCCGSAPGMKDAAGQPVRICVDHIKPISKFWHLRLERSNLQILCDECNQGKGNWDQTDFRTPDEWVAAPFEDAVLDVLASMKPANDQPA